MRITLTSSQKQFTNKQFKLTRDEIEMVKALIRTSNELKRLDGCRVVRTPEEMLSQDWHAPSASVDAIMVNENETRAGVQTFCNILTRKEVLTKNKYEYQLCRGYLETLKPNQKLTLTRGR